MMQKQITLRASPSARLSAQTSTSRGQKRSLIVRVLNAAQSPASPGPRLAPVPFNDVQKRVLPLLSELVEIQVCGSYFNLQPQFQSVTKALAIALTLYYSPFCRL
jgi:hypothetical protein